MKLRIICAALMVSACTTAAKVDKNEGGIVQSEANVPGGEVAVAPQPAIAALAPQTQEVQSRFKVSPLTGRMIKVREDLSAGTKEVTVRQFALFLANSDYRVPKGCATYADGQWINDPKLGWGDPGFPQSDTHPVTCISALDAQAYVKWLNDTLRPSKPYRLPTSEEWAYAASGGLDSDYPWGSTFKVEQANCAASKCQDQFQHTSPVGRFPSFGGLYDALGNVWEYTLDSSPENTGVIFQMGGSYSSMSGKYFNLRYKNPLPANERSNVSGFRIFQ